MLKEHQEKILDLLEQLEVRKLIRQIKEETLDHQMKMKNAWEQEKKSASP